MDVQVVIQIFLGTLAPLSVLAATQLWKFAENARRALYVVASSLTVIGILAMRDRGSVRQVRKHCPASRGSGR